MGNGQWGKFWIAYDGFTKRQPVVVQFQKKDTDKDGTPTLKARQSLSNKGFNRLMGTFKSLSEANDRIARM